MSPSAKRISGILVFIVAAVVAVADLRRFGGIWVSAGLPALLICFGVALMRGTKKR